LVACPSSTTRPLPITASGCARQSVQQRAAIGRGGEQPSHLEDPAGRPMIAAVRNRLAVAGYRAQSIQPPAACIAARSNRSDRCSPLSRTRTSPARLTADSGPIGSPSRA